MLTRTSDEISARMEAVRSGFMDFQSSDLLEWLPFDLAKPNLKDGVTAEQWAEVQKAGDPLDIARDYLPFAWDKANNCRGLSAGRSIEHMKAWLWLAGHDLGDEFDARYEFYGKQCLVIASEIVGFDWRAEDDGRWMNEEDGPALSEARRASEVDRALAFVRAIAEPAA